MGCQDNSIQTKKFLTYKSETLKNTTLFDIKIQNFNRLTTILVNDILLMTRKVVNMKKKLVRGEGNCDGRGAEREKRETQIHLCI